MVWSRFSAIFDNFRQKIFAFLKNQCYDSIFARFSFAMSQKRQLFCRFFRRKYLKNHNIGPWSETVSVSRFHSIADVNVTSTAKKRSKIWNWTCADSFREWRHRHRAAAVTSPSRGSKCFPFLSTFLAIRTLWWVGPDFFGLGSGSGRARASHFRHGLEKTHKISWT
jgi:hypothetical protein